MQCYGKHAPPRCVYIITFAIVSEIFSFLGLLALQKSNLVLLSVSYTMCGAFGSLTGYLLVEIALYRKDCSDKGTKALELLEVKTIQMI